MSTAVTTSIATTDAGATGSRSTKARCWSCQRTQQIDPTTTSTVTATATTAQRGSGSRSDTGDGPGRLRAARTMARPRVPRA